MVNVQISFCYGTTMFPAFPVSVKPWLCIKFCNRISSVTYYKYFNSDGPKYQQTSVKLNCYIECLSIAYIRNSLLVIILAIILEIVLGIAFSKHLQGSIPLYTLHTKKFGSKIVNFLTILKCYTLYDLNDLFKTTTIIFCIRIPIRCTNV